ncbi:MAG: DNA alkylation repair protein [Planctomycetaceae bacterium]|nr:DNA alkylation repair protein [Planctomycetaceae bacterium]
MTEDHEQPTGTGFSLKDHLFNQDRVRYLAELFRTADSSFDAARFRRAVMKRLLKLELKERIVHIAATLEDYLDRDFRQAAQQITAALPPPLDPANTDDDFGDFIFAPLGEFVVRNGIARKYLRLSLRTLKEITQRFSMEDAIRQFINTHTNETLCELKKWSTDPNYHVRRLVSEGTRPILPWSGRLSMSPAVAIPLLDQLHADPTRYVTRSVSNHLNDISKSEPGLVFDALQRWKSEGRQNSPELHWMSKHALRTLVKQGNAQALQFLGFNSNPKIAVSQFTLMSSTIRPGQAIDFELTVQALRNELLMVDYVIDFLKANGKLSPKVHKLKQLEIQKGQTVVLRKRHLLKANATTYKLYPGTHQLTLQINGQPFGTLAFEVQ